MGKRRKKPAREKPLFLVWFSSASVEWCMASVFFAPIVSGDARLLLLTCRCRPRMRSIEVHHMRFALSKHLGASGLQGLRAIWTSSH
ncbi:hypothetical protein BDW75DRAFT_188752 [Aspergillus navahoensis]